MHRLRTHEAAVSSGLAGSGTQQLLRALEIRQRCSCSSVPSPGFSHPGARFWLNTRSVQLRHLYRTGIQHSHLAESHLALRHLPRFCALHPWSRARGWPQDMAPEPGQAPPRSACPFEALCTPRPSGRCAGRGCERPALPLACEIEIFPA